MKHIIALFCLALAFTSCEGEQGIDGIDGEVVPAFEIEVDFNAGNGYGIVQDYGFDIVDSDVVLVYISWENDEGTDIWRLVPQTQYFDEGILTYNYDFTDNNFSIFLEATFDLGLLGDEWTQNQYFRVVIVPADYINGVDTSNYDDVISATNFETI